MLALDLADVIGRGIDSRVTDVWTALPGTIKSYDAAKQTATIAPALKRPIPSDENPDAVKHEELPDIADVPIAFMRGGGCYIVFPLQPGDSVLLVFSTLDPGPWRESTGGPPAEVEDTRHAHIAHAFAIPCIAPDAKTLAGATQGALVLDAGAIKLGVAAMDRVGLATQIELEFAKVILALNAIALAAGTANSYTAVSNLGSGKVGVEP